MRIVLDTCVLVAAARSLEGASNRILRSLPIDGIEPCLSVALYAEWQEVLCRPVKGVGPTHSHILQPFRLNLEFWPYECTAKKQELARQKILIDALSGIGNIP